MATSPTSTRKTKRDYATFGASLVSLNKMEKEMAVQIKNNTLAAMDRIGLEKEIVILARYYTFEEIIQGTHDVLKDLQTLRDLRIKPCVVKN